MNSKSLVNMGSDEIVISEIEFSNHLHVPDQGPHLDLAPGTTSDGDIGGFDC